MLEGGVDALVGTTPAFPVVLVPAGHGIASRVMSPDAPQPVRIALVTPSTWTAPSPRNDYIARLADALDARADVVVIAPSSGSVARRVTRRALRGLARGATAEQVWRAPELRAAIPGRRRPSGMRHAWPLLSLPPAVGPLAVGQRSGLRLVLEHGGFDVVVVVDPLADELTRHVARRGHGLTVALATRAPEPTALGALGRSSRERVLDGIDRWVARAGVDLEPLLGRVPEGLVWLAPGEDIAGHAGQVLATVDDLRARVQVHLPSPRSARRTSVIDLHMHTNHSWDCATDPEALMYAARRVGLTAIAVTDHNEISGALACAEFAEDYGVQVIVGEEVKTRDGEVIGLFLVERIEPGLGWHETLARIREQDGLVYVPHPFDRLHTIPSAQLLRDTVDEIDAFEVYNARLAFEGYNRDAQRFASRYNLVEGAGSDAHVPQGLGTAAVHMPAWDDQESFLTALRQGEVLRRPKSLLYLQGLKWVNDLTGRSKPLPADAVGSE